MAGGGCDVPSQPPPAMQTLNTCHSAERGKGGHHMTSVGPVQDLSAETPRADFYVAPHGADTNPGTAAAPFATPARAQQAVHQRVAAGLHDNILVLLRGGTYRLSEPLQCTPGDGGTAAFSVTYAAYPGERVILSGGQVIRGWTR